MENTFYLDDDVPYAIGHDYRSICADNAVGKFFAETGQLPVAVTTPEFIKYLHRMSLNPDLNKKLNQNIQSILKTGDTPRAVMIIMGEDGNPKSIRDSSNETLFVFATDNDKNVIAQFPREVISW
jgi:hypothetical protein